MTYIRNDWNVISKSTYVRAPRQDQDRNILLTVNICLWKGENIHKHSFQN
ncbi:Uncharacterized protein APZ42_027546 [Daphnia magna]|uniref:Uncharacterized protein n=1 Tax=Daphnia magna TaxID=35525 RepID=A0A164R9D4_9CRUS|nr:Uncharacterized protein APZ42_027546 [Daphnia magna]